MSFALPKKAVLAFAGPNGAGKATLLNLLSGMAEVTNGEVLLEGQRLSALSLLDRAAGCHQSQDR